MSTSATLIEEPLSQVAEERRLQYFRDSLKDFDQEVSPKTEKFAEFREWLDQLSDDAITTSYQQVYNPTYLNLLAVFGEELPHEEVHSLAIKCIKTKLWDECEYYFRLSELIDLIKHGRNKNQSLLRLTGWDIELIRSLLQRGRGLIISSFRFGAIRYIPIELALLGFPALEVVNAPGLRVMQAAFASLGACGKESVLCSNGDADPRSENLHLLKTVNAEDARCTVELVDALKRREIIGMCIEGNTGSDGPWGDTSKTKINFLDCRILVKNGVARLAAALRVPILPVMAVRDGDTSGSLFFSEPIIPPASLKRSENEEFVRASMQSLYSRFESFVRRYPAQWEGWSAMHRWRVRDDVPANAQAMSNTDPKQIDELLRDGRRFTMNKRRVAQLATKDGVMWVDLKTLKGFRNPEWAASENILAVLSKTGLDRAWVDNASRDPQWKEKICLLLAYLQESDLVTSC
jgi:lipid A biosynthesis acyltransferase